MSRLEELIQELCPDGVEYKNIGDIALVTKLAGFEFTKYVSYSDNGNIIALRGLNVKNGKIDLTDVKYIDNSDLSKLSRSKLCVGDMLFTYVGTIGQVALIDQDDKYYLAPNVAMIRILDKNIMPKYMLYYFQSNMFWNTQINKLLQSSSMKNIPMEKIRKFKIPVPPLEVQGEIVKILDNFTDLTERLKSELTVELTAREKQYTYYRNELLTFNNETQHKTLGELGSFYGGLTGKSKDDFQNGNAKFISYKNVYANPALKIDVDDTVKITEGENQRTIEYGDVIFTGSSETPDECGISSVLTVKTDEKLYLNSFCFIFRFDDPTLVYPAFSKHLFRSHEMRRQIIKTASGVTRYNVSKDKIKKVKIPIPPLDVQIRLANVLDNFDAICSDLNIGLPAEIEARRKQYEYYRDKLLTFKEKC